MIEDPVMRRVFLCTLLVLGLPAAASASARTAAPVRASAFSYPWYGTAAEDGSYQHWSQDNHSPPNDIASAFYPALGLYSSSDQNVVATQMDEVEAAGIDQLIVSWWGRGSPEDQRLPLIVAAARADDISVAAHLEPYAGRSVASTVGDVAYLHA